MRSADEQKRDRTKNLHCSKLSPYSQTSNSGSFHRSNSALRLTIRLCKTWIGDQWSLHPVNFGVELNVDVIVADDLVEELERLWLSHISNAQQPFATRREAI